MGLGDFPMTKRIKNIFHHVGKPLDAILLKNGTMPFLDDNFFYVRSCVRQSFFPGAEIAFMNIMKNDLKKNVSWG